MQAARPLQEPTLLSIKSQFNVSLSRSHRLLLQEIIEDVKDHLIHQAYFKIQSELHQSRFDPFLHYLLGRLAAKFGDLELSKSHLSQAFYHATPKRDLLNHCFISLANLLFSCRQLEELRALLLWQQRHETTHDLFFMFGALYEFEGRFNQAIDSYKKALKLNNYSHFSRLALARCLFQKGDSLNALHEVKKVQKPLSKHSYLWTLMGQIYLTQNQNELALKILKRALRLNRNHALTYQLLGDYYRTRHIKKAIAFYHRSLSADQPSFKVYAQLSKLYKELGHYEAAIAQLDLYRCFVSSKEQSMVQRQIAQLKALKTEKEQSYDHKKTWFQWWFN